LIVCWYIGVSFSILTVPVVVSIDTVSILKETPIVNSVVVSKRERDDIILAIFNIFSEVDLNDSLESLELLSKYILARKRKKIKLKKSKKHDNKGKK
jgi:hypothetical protein